MAEFLLEFLSEEIPARMQARAADDLRRLVLAKLEAAQLTCKTAQAFTTPRRLALVVDGLPPAQPDRTIERKGPRVGAPEKAMDGFLGSVGLELKQCEKREVKGSEFWFAVIEQPGRSTAEVLADIVGEVAHELTWPKSMRWLDGPFRWVRPLHGVLALFDGAKLDGALKLGGTELPFGDTTVGHRFHAPEPFAVASFDDYREKLRGAYVVLDPAERRARIADRASGLAHAEGLRLRDDPALHDEVAGLVEWPVVLMGHIDEAFMAVPPEVLITSMRTHQRYFALNGPNLQLAPRFVVVANMETDDESVVVAGNERVLRARLSDAKYFWDQDRKMRLEERLPRLEEIVFHAQLGTVRARVDRLQAMAAELCSHIADADRDHARSAALLCKADLVTEMVAEFPELQGTMGRYYALAEGEKRPVADAIAEHYSPAGPADTCPTKPVSVALALAEKLDTLVGFFSIGETPTGSKDPFALRRAALGVIRLIVENRLRLRLTIVFREARRAYNHLDGPPDALDTLLAFFADRLKVHLREEGVAHDHVAAVFALGGEDDLIRIIARVRVLGEFLGSEDGANLLIAYRRAASIVRVEEKRDGVAFDGDAYDASLAQGDEAALVEALEAVTRDLDTPLATEDYGAAMAVLARLRLPVDRFFDTVTVNVDDADLRANRLRLLARITATMNRIAVFSHIEG